MTKIPAVILVKLMLGLGPDQQAVVESLVGAYAICMAPQGKPPLLCSLSPVHPTRALGSQHVHLGGGSPHLHERHRRAPAGRAGRVRPRQIFALLPR